MFVNEFFFSLSILSFAALLCLFGALIVIDGIIFLKLRAIALALCRLTPEWSNLQPLRRQMPGNG
jgi:hypothetical protein